MMQSRTVSVILFFLIAHNALGQNSKEYIIKGNIEGLPDKTPVYLVRDFGKDTAQKTISKGEEFSFKGVLEREGEFYFIRTDSNILKGGSKGILLVNAPIKVKSSLQNWPSINVSGSVAHDEWQVIRIEINQIQANFQRVEDSVNMIRGQLKTAKEESDPSAISDAEKQLEAMMPRFNEVVAQRKELVNNLIKKYPNSLFVPYLIISNPMLFSFERMKETYEKFSEKSKSSYYGHIAKEWIEAGNLQEGAIVNDFKGITPDQIPISLREVLKNNKYVLIDFWASWCKPCRDENPALKKVYEMYKEKGFEVLSVTSDANLKSWKDAIAKDGMTWKHIADSKLSGAIAKMYGITALPAWYLVDKNGFVIYAKENIRHDLEKKLAELLDKKE